MKLVPKFDRVLIKLNPKKDSNVGGIVIPDTDTKQVVEGTVIAVGEGLPDEPMAIKVGETVLLQKYSGVNVSEEGEDFVITKQHEILASKQ